MRPVARPLRFTRRSSSDGSSLHVQENSQHQCRLHCAMHDCGHAKRPHRLVPRAGPGQNKGALSCNLGARSPENNDFAVRAPLIFCNFLCPACQRAGHTPAAEGQNAQTQRLRWRDADALKRNRSAPQFHPTRAGLQFRHFPAWRCRNASRVHNDGDTTLVQKKTRLVAQPRRKGAQKVQCGRRVVVLFRQWFSKFAWRIRLCGFSCNFCATARAQQRVRVTFRRLGGSFLFRRVFHDFTVPFGHHRRTDLHDCEPLPNVG